MGQRNRPDREKEQWGEGEERVGMKTWEEAPGRSGRSREGCWGRRTPGGGGVERGWVEHCRLVVGGEQSQGPGTGDPSAEC